MHALVQVDGVFTGDDILEGGTCLAGLVFVRTSKVITWVFRGREAATSGRAWSTQVLGLCNQTHLFGASLGGLKQYRRSFQHLWMEFRAARRRTMS